MKAWILNFILGFFGLGYGKAEETLIAQRRRSWFPKKKEPKQ